MPAKHRKGWTRVAFGDVVRLVRERSPDPEAGGFDRYVGLEHLEPGDLRIRRWGEVAAGTTFTNVFRVRQVLFGKRRAYQHKVAVADFDGVCSGDIYVFEPRNDRLISGLLPFICQTNGFFEHAVGTSAGSLSPRTNWESLAAYEFILPPLEEQGQFVKVLAGSAAAGDALRLLAKSLKVLRQASIDSLTDNELWPEVAVADICKMQNGRPFPGSAYAEDGIPLLRPGNLDESGYFTWDRSKTVFLSKKWALEAADFLINPGDVVMNLTAQSLEDGFMGRVCLAGMGDRSLLNQRIGRFNSWASGVLPEYVFRAFQSSRFQAHAVEMCEGSKVKHIFWPYIARFRLRLPQPEEQQEVVNALRQTDECLGRLAKRTELRDRLHGELIADALDPEEERSSAQ